MSRIAFTSAYGDPFILLLCIKLFREKFYDEVDKYYVNVNNHAGVPQVVISELLSKIVEDPKIHLIYHPHGIGNGPPLTEMLLLCKEELIVLIEDDGFIFTPGKVNECFKRIESGEFDALGSPRGSCGKEVWDGMQKKYNLDYSGYGDVGPNFWPNFFFCKRKDLLATDLDFGSKKYSAGEYLKEIDHTFAEDNYSDTFVWADIQMRYNGVRFGHIPQFHASPTEPEDKHAKVMNWYNGQIPYWIHGGSLSSGWGGYLNKSIPPMNTLMEKREIESRVAFWTIASDVIPGFDEFKKEYKAGIANLIHKGGLEYSRIQEKVNLYRNLMKI